MLLVAVCCISHDIVVLQIPNVSRIDYDLIEVDDEGFVRSNCSCMSCVLLHVEEKYAQRNVTVVQAACMAEFRVLRCLVCSRRR